MYNLIEGTEMNHYNYLITNTYNELLYYGVRSCECSPEDDTEYMSSSKHLKSDMHKLGVSGFTKEIVSIFDTRLEANTAEEEYLTKVDAGYSKMYYNKTNGNLKFCTQGLTKETSESIALNSEKQKQDWIDNREVKIAKIHHKGRDYLKSIAGLLKAAGTGDSKLKGNDRTEAQKASSKLSSERLLKEGNPLHSKESVAKRTTTITGRKRPSHAKDMTGRVSVIKDGKQRKLKKEEVDVFLANGWELGSISSSGYTHKEVVCPHCKKKGAGGNMKRYHFDNCKLKDNK